MKRNYEALLGAFYGKYFEFKNMKMSNDEALARTSNDFEGVLKLGEMENAVVHIAIGNIILSHTRTYYKVKDQLIEVLNSIDLEKLQLETSLDEYQDILERRDMVLDEIDNIQIDYDPYARWYSFEMEKEVKSYFGNIICEDESELVEKIIERFERDCDKTLSENIVVKTTLAELLIRHGIKSNEQIVKIRSELEQFDLNNVGKQLSEFEKLDLSIRIKEVLDKL
ncbi:hypothetical protein BBR47_12830 [Brevibacillus brevis NBRC 100599]|uniref:Uncharacterized protein n=1 Tax=Brevibacillus brevis (strain 47 / JCM 6285 / NBRC 100599) TaxID=358681 RepID=C0Z7L7_BREBN|nr:Imm3 family immunity protein [Brevibacillus brevis]BAH42260.1 hypothetical protein BBR47_12830 [Brevibacillus brevis NBRC 100599]